VEPVARAPAPSDPAWDWARLRRSARAEARRVLGDPQEAEDATQEAMVRAWRQRQACRSPEAPEGWLRQIARNEAFRRHGRAAAQRTEPLAERYEPADALDERSLDRVFVRQALAKLRREDRHLFILRYELDLADVAIAERLGIAETTVRVRIHRLKQQLRVLRGGNEGD
jgi:RNA polymerase sigma-70 factor (ECF subfamily)